jgi:hypothetical protein
MGIKDLSVIRHIKGFSRKPKGNTVHFLAWKRKDSLFFALRVSEEEMLLSQWD